MIMKRLFSILVAASMSTLLMAQTDTLQLRELVVTGTRSATDMRHLPMTVTVIDRQKLTEQHQTNVLPTALQQVPGLFVTSRSMMGYGVSTGAAGGINIRGITSGSGQLMVLIDGHPQYNGVYGHPLSDSYQTLMAERVEVLRGPTSVLYGSNAMGGVLNIVTRSMLEDGVKTNIQLGAGSYGTVQAEASNQLRCGRFSSTAAAQYSRTDNHRPNMGFEQFGGYLKLGYDLSAHWKAYADANITHWSSSNPGKTDQLKLENDQWITRGEVSMAIENHYERTNGALSIYDNFGRHKINDGYAAKGGTPQTDLFRSKDAVAGVSWYQSAQLFEGNHFTVGLDYQHIYGRAYYTDRETGEVVKTKQRQMQSTHAHENEIAGYVDFRQDLLQWLTIDAGLRYDHHSVAGGEWIPQAGLVVRPMATGEIKALVSKGFRNPTAKEMYLYKSANDQLEPERLWNYELSWHHRICKLTYGANLFYIKGDNMIQAITINGSPKNVNTGKIENYGLEVDARYRIDEHWNLSTNHSFLKMKERKIAAAPRYKGMLEIGYRQPKWYLTACLQYISGLGLDSDDDGIKDMTEKDICLLNLSASYSITPAIALWARGENLLAQRYEINYGYPMPHATFMSGFSINF